jgi:hypothetical protein
MRRRLMRLLPIPFLLALILSAALAPSAQAGAGVAHGGELHCSDIAVGHYTNVGTGPPAVGSTYDERQRVAWQPELVRWDGYRWVLLAKGPVRYATSYGAAHYYTSTSSWQYGVYFWEDAYGHTLTDPSVHWDNVYLSAGNNYIGVINTIWWYRTARDPGGSKRVWSHHRVFTNQNFCHFLH